MINEELLFWIVIIALIGLIVWWLRHLILAVFGLILAAIVGLFTFDWLTRKPGQKPAIEQLADKIADWLRRRAQ